MEPAGGSATAARRPDSNASHPPQLMPALPLSTRRPSATKPPTTRSASMRTVTPRRLSGLENGHHNRGGDDSDASDEEEEEDDDDDDDDDAYVTSNDYAATPERGGVRDSSTKVDWKGKGKAVVTDWSEDGAGGNAARSGEFGDAHEGEDLYGDD